jgi:hypothetical protein
MRSVLSQVGEIARPPSFAANQEARATTQYLLRPTSCQGTAHERPFRVNARERRLVHRTPPRRREWEERVVCAVVEHHERAQQEACSDHREPAGDPRRESERDTRCTDQPDVRRHGGELVRDGAAALRYCVAREGLLQRCVGVRQRRRSHFPVGTGDPENLGRWHWIVQRRKATTPQTRGGNVEMIAVRTL